MDKCVYKDRVDVIEFIQPFVSLHLSPLSTASLPPSSASPPLSSVFLPALPLNVTKTQSAHSNIDVATNVLKTTHSSFDFFSSSFAFNLSAFSFSSFSFFSRLSRSSLSFFSRFSLCCSSFSLRASSFFFSFAALASSFCLCFSCCRRSLSSCSCKLYKNIYIYILKADGSK